MGAYHEYRFDLSALADDELMKARDFIDQHAATGCIDTDDYHVVHAIFTEDIVDWMDENYPDAIVRRYL